jgi:penicillin-binding protein 1A
MALPIWANYMRSCYENEELNISKEEFEEPEELSIEVDCVKYLEDNKERLKNEQGDEPEIDF